MSRKPKSYYHVTDGEWIVVARRGYKEQCCDCGLVHRMNFRIKDGRIEVQTFRDGPATGGARRHKFAELDDIVEAYRED